MKNKIGVVTSTYPNYNTVEALEGISEAGFKYIELASAPAYFEHIIPSPEKASEEDVQNVLNLCKKYGIVLYCIAGHTRLLTKTGLADFKKVLDYAGMAEIGFVTTDVGEIENEDSKKQFFHDIQEIGDYAKSKSVTVCLEMHGKWCNNGKTGSEIIEKVNHPNIRLNYDTGNVMLYGGVRPEEDIKNALPYMAFMHIKDDGGKLFEWNFPALGDGNVDFEKILELLKDYNGPISLEVEFDGKERTLQEINTAVKKSYDFLQDHGMV
jgi:sugar phosphate isomerase/epimerase